jgi:hypothetical protein
MESYDFDNVLDAHFPRAGLVTCSICLRVQRESGWVPAEEAIRELRSFELRDPIRLAAGLCDDCADDLALRRTDAAAQAA